LMGMIEYIEDRQARARREQVPVESSAADIQHCGLVRDGKPCHEILHAPGTKSRGPTCVEFVYIHGCKILRQFCGKRIACKIQAGYRASYRGEATWLFSCACLSWYRPKQPTPFLPTGSWSSSQPAP